MKLPLPTDELKQLIHLNSSEYTVQRDVDEQGKSKYGETVHSDSELLRTLYVFDPNEVNVPTQFGERIQGDMFAISLPNTDVVRGDVVEHPNGLLEVEETDLYQQYGETVYEYYALQRVSNDR